MDPGQKSAGPESRRQIVCKQSSSPTDAASAHPCKLRKICDTTARLSLSAGVGVQSTGLTQAVQAPRFDFLFISTDQDLHRLLAQRAAQQPQADILLMTQADGLTRDDLVNRLSILDDGQHSLSKGRLFDNGNRELHLILDVRQMTGEEIGAFNDLLDPVQPELYHKPARSRRALGPQVSITVLATRDQVPVKSNTGNTNVAGGDFWRRINRPGNSWNMPSDTAAMDVDPQSSLPVPAWPGSANGQPAPVVINLHLSQDWRRLLYGGPGVNRQGQICHLPGVLESLQPDQSVLLRGDMADNLELQQHLGQLVRLGRYQSNGIDRQLPPGLHFYHQPVPAQELTHLSQTAAQITSVSTLAALPDNLVVVNASNLAQWLNPICIDDDGCCVPNANLITQLSQGKPILVSSPLSEAQWFLLLGQLLTFCESTGSKPAIILPSSLQRMQPETLTPEVLATGDAQARPDWSPGVTASFYANETQLDGWLQQQSPSPLVVQISAQTTASQLFDNSFVRSEKPPRFGRQLTQLQQALEQGTPVVIRGLETNPVMQQILESLCSSPASVMVNGKVAFYPHANIHVLWPEGKKCAALLWDASLQSASSMMEVDVWETSARRHGMSVAAIPRHAIEKIYEFFAMIPSSVTEGCDPLPVLNGPLLDSLITAARQAQQADRAADLQPRHWRKAVNSVLTHCTRHNRPVRDFLKVSCERLFADPEPKQWVDQQRLALLISSLATPDTNAVYQNFWSLARAFGPGILDSLPWHFDRVRGQAILDMKAWIITQVPPELRPPLELAWKPDPQLLAQCPKLPSHAGSRIKRLEDALASGWAPVPGLRNLSCLIENVANTCESVANNPQASKAEQLQAIENTLAQLLYWPGHSPAPLAGLARDMLLGCQNQLDLQQRRLSRLKARLAQSPVLFIEGETATGKSFFSSQLARQSGQAWIASVGPATREQELVQKWVWKDAGNDSGRYMERRQQTLLQWAQTQPRPTDDYLTLVLDEANLAQDGLLDCLTGLWDQPPCVYIDGQPVHVSTKHRVILTGNPLSYAGRHMNSSLLNRMQRLHYPPLSTAFLQDLVVEPALRQHLALTLSEPGLQTAVGHTAAAVLTLWQHYQPLLPEYVFTARDLTDICAWVGWYLQQRPTSIAVTPAYLATLAWQASQDVLGLALPEHHKDAEYALRCWFTGRYPLDEITLASLKAQTLAVTVNGFRTMTHHNHPDFDTSNAAVSELADCLAQDLMRCQWAFEHNTRHGGRQATLIEGPTGRGKDATLQHLLTSYKSQVHARGGALPEQHSLNAKECSWETLAGRIRAAQVHGHILVISELNLIPSAYLEGELNAILAGDAHPGFHLFATTNPPDYSGRKLLSPALKGRFRYCPLRGYNAGELEQIARRVLPSGPHWDLCAHQLSQFHCLLRQRLLDEEAGVPPTARGLQDLALAVARTGAVSGPALETLADQHYQIYLLASGTCAAQLLHGQASAPAPAPQLRGNSCDRTLTRWLNSTVNSLETPWLINRGAFSAINHLKNTITLAADLTEPDGQNEALRMLAGIQWTASGLTLDPPESEDTLVRALYRRWQQLWYMERFKSSLAEAQKVFALEPLEAATLALEANRLYVEELSLRVQARGDTGPLHRPAFWQQLKSVADLPTKHYAPCPGTGSAGEENSAQDAQDVPDESAPAVPTELDTQTKYSTDAGALPVMIERYIFTPDTELPRNYRLTVYDVAISAQGRLLQIPMGDGEYGLEVVEPGTLPDANTSISINPVTQRYGMTTFIVGDRPWQPLPSLTSNDKLLAIRIEHDDYDATAGNQPANEDSVPCRVTRDRYTGLFRVHIPSARRGDSFNISYFLEIAKSSKQTSSVCAVSNAKRPDASCSQAMQDTIDQLFAPQTLQSLPADQRAKLESIAEATDLESRERLIASYCRSFNGEYDMEADDNQLLFLLKERQGACRHRAPVFVMLCRYFGIPARLVDNEIHAYAEFSLDNGITWKNRNLGGEPCDISICKPKHAFVDFSSSGRRINTRMKKLTTYSKAQRIAMAKALGISLEELENAEKTGTLLPIGGDIKHGDVIQKLWTQNTEDAFLVSIWHWQEQRVPWSAKICGENFGKRSFYPLSSAIYQLIRSNQYTAACQDALVQLRAESQGEKHIDPDIWGKEITLVLNKILSDAVPVTETVMSFCREALQRNWLRYGHIQGFRAETFLEALEKLARIPEFRPLVEKVSQDWYNSFPGQPYPYGDKPRSGNAREHLVVSHSPALEQRLMSADKAVVWTDEPEGAPNVGRLLTGDPAFTRLGSCSKTNSLIVTGIPDWNIWQERSAELLEFYFEVNPDRHSAVSQKNEIFNKINRRSISQAHERAIKFSFILYLYKLQKSMGIRLVFCWMKTNINSHRESYFGHCSPKNADQLINAMNDNELSESINILRRVSSDKLSKALGLPDSYILMRQDLDQAYRDFVFNLPKEDLYKAVNELLPTKHLLKE